ncbi:ABC transporter permease subunit, partial [Acinetobacter pittii]|uniref:ABC transporter permease subunit n=1 Tax=Acinetobacter pittii TaxID=48296 RepID=UPI00227D284A
HLAISSWRALVGFAIGGSIGLILGLISGLSRRGERLLDTSIQMLRNVPHLALIPLVILWFGIDETAKIFLVSLGTLFPIYINTSPSKSPFRLLTLMDACSCAVLVPVREAVSSSSFERFWTRIDAAFRFSTPNSFTAWAVERFFPERVVSAWL